jgi:nitrate/nitrite transport system ATP-binding protein
MSAFIEARHVSKAFAGRTVREVLRNVTLTVEHGEFVSVLGAMGAGKSTLLALLAGLTAPDRGTIAIAGEPVRGIRHDASYVFQNYSLLPWFTALENVRLAVGAARPDLAGRQQRARAREMLERVGLGNAVTRRPGQLSGGMRQRVAIARAFATDPRILFLDEPFGALDALTRETLQQELARLCIQTDRPVTTVMVTNSVDEAILLSDRIVPLLAGPPATLGVPIPVELPRPRSPAQLAHDDHAVAVRAHVVATLTASLVGSRRRAPGRTAAAVAPEEAVGARPSIAHEP